MAAWLVNNISITDDVPVSTATWRVNSIKIGELALYTWRVNNIRLITDSPAGPSWRVSAIRLVGGPAKIQTLFAVDGGVFRPIAFYAYINGVWIEVTR